MKTDLTRQFNLPSYTKGKSFAEASKAIENKFKDRSDKVSNETKQDLLQRLADAQEYLKEQSQPQVEPNQMMFGGDVPDEAPGIGTYIGAASTAMDLGTMAFGDTGIDTSGREDVKASDVKVGGKVASGALKGAQAGMAFGPWGAAIGGVVGAGAGLIGGTKAKKDAIEGEFNSDLKKANNYRPNDYAFGGDLNKIGVIDPNRPNRANPVDQEAESFKENTAWTNKRDAFYKDTYDAWRQQKTGNSPNHKLSQSDPVYQQFWKDTKSNWANNNPRPVNKLLANKVDSNGIFTEDYAKGGYVNKYVKGGYSNGVQESEDLYNFAKNGIDAMENPDTIPSPKTGVGNFLDKYGKKAGEVINKYGAEAMRFAPIAANLFGKIDKPTTARGSRAGTIYKPSYFDEAALTNSLNQNNLNSGLKESSGGNMGNLSTNLLAGHLNKKKAESDARLKGEAVNSAEDEKVFKSISANERINLNLDRDYNDRKARDEGAYNTAKSAQRSALFEDIGKVGRELQDKKTIKNMYGYRFDGTYVKQADGTYKDENGKVISKEAYDLGQKAKSKKSK